MPLYEFAPSFTVDQTDLSLTATGSGVHLNKVVNVNLGILDRVSGGIGDNRSFLANPYVNNVSLDILNIDGTVKFQDFLTNYKSNGFSITEYDNINIFGEYTKDFGVKATVSESSQTNTAEFYFYGNVPEFSGITVRDSTGTTSHAASQSSKTAVNASGQTGVLTSTVTFNNDSNYISFDRLEIYSSTGSAAFNSQIDPNPVFSRNLSNETIQSFDINEGELPSESAVYLHFVPYGQLGTGEVWTLGPYTFKDNPPAANPYITEVTSGDITGALGFTPISSQTDDQTLSEVLVNGNSAALGFTVGSSEITGDLTVGGDIITSGATSIGSGGNPLNLKGNFVTLQYAATSSSTPETFLQISSSEQVEFYREANLNSGARISAGQDLILGGAVIQADTDTSKSAIKYAADNIAFSVSGTIDASSSEFTQSNEINSFASAILLGTKNKIFGDFSTILAGSENIISGEESTSSTLVNSDFDFIGAGSGNQITGSRFSSIVGGVGNKVFKTSDNSFIGGGAGNVLEGSPNSVIGGGVNNYINSAESVQIFGSYVTGTSTNDGYIYLADNQNRTKTPNASDTLFIDFEGGVDIKTGDLTVQGNITMSGSNVLTDITSGHITGALGYTPLSTETDDQTLDEVLAQGNTSSRNITAGIVTGSNGLRGQDVQIGVTDSAMIDTSAGNLDIGSAGGTTILGDAKVSVTNKLGVGTASPLYPFALENSGTGLISRLYNTNADGDGVLIRAGSTSSATRALQVASTNDTKILTVNSNGRVGITTTSPDYLLDIGGDTASANNTIRMVQANNGTAIRIGAGGGSNDVNVLRVDGGTSVNKGESDSSNYGFSLRYKGSGSGANNSLAFFTDNSAAGSQIEALTILNDGKVGIGSTAPGCNLQVAAGTTIPVTTAPNGSISICSVSGTTTPTILGRQTANAVGMYLMAATANGNTAGDMVFNVRENNNSTFATTTNSAFRFQHFTTNLLSILRNGDIGIGTTSPSSKLQITDNHSQLRLEDSDDSKFLLHSYSGGKYVVRNNSTSTTVNQFTLTEDGEFGIGTISPSSILHLASTGPAVLTIEADTDNATETDNARIVLKQDGAIVVGRMGYENNTNALEFINEFNDSLSLGTNNNKRFTITGSGNASFTGAVGINTSSPEQELHVYQGTAKFESTNGSDVSLQLGRSDVSNLWNFNHAGGDLRIYNAGGSGYDIMFGVNAGGGSSSNKVGINTASPSTALHVEGTITHKVYTVAALPSASPEGQRSFVSDASSVLDVNLGATVSAGGSNLVPVFSDGSNWIVG